MDKNWRKWKVDTWLCNCKYSKEDIPIYRNVVIDEEKNITPYTIESSNMGNRIVYTDHCMISFGAELKLESQGQMEKGKLRMDRKKQSLFKCALQLLFAITHYSVISLVVEKLKSWSRVEFVSPPTIRLVLQSPPKIDRNKWLFDKLTWLTHC